MTRPRLARIFGVVLLLAAALVVGWLWWARFPTIDFVVPDGYEGWLVVAWGCPNGARFADLETDRWSRRHRIAYGADGAVCVADSHPEFFTYSTFAYASGAPAPVIAGGTRGRTEQWNLSVGGATPQPTAASETYSYASLGIGDEYVIGDGCALDAFLLERFGDPRSGGCGPIYRKTPPATPRAVTSAAGLASVDPRASVVLASRAATR